LARCLNRAQREACCDVEREEAERRALISRERAAEEPANPRCVSDACVETRSAGVCEAKRQTKTQTSEPCARGAGADSDSAVRRKAGSAARADNAARRRALNMLRCSAKARREAG